MFKIFYADKDATLYQGMPDTNTGIDEVLEIGKRYGLDGSVLYESRALVKFNTNEIQNALTKYSVDVNDCKFMLQLYTTDAKNLSNEYTITANIVAQDWVNGTGFLNSDYNVDNGITWNRPMSGSTWISSSQMTQYKDTSFYIAGGNTGGGSWIYELTSSFFNHAFFNQAFLSNSGPTTYDTDAWHEPTDINLNVTDAVYYWISGSGGTSIDNNGLILRYSDADAADANVSGYLRYFSKDTHTIYVPKLIMYWDNSTFTTGSLTSINTDSYIIYADVKPQYKDTEVAKIRIYARDKFPRKSPTNLAPYQSVKHLPPTAYYTVIDAVTDEVIIPYDDIYNKISCDSTSNFIYIDMTGFMPERYYRLEFKIIDGITEQYVTDSVYFKVIR
jgi:hypothetical protein